MEVTRPGIEGGPNVTGERSGALVTTVGSDGERPPVTSGCNECNEVSKAAAEGIQAARRLAVVATNAIANGDLRRALGALFDLQHTMATPDVSRVRRGHEG